MKSENMVVLELFTSQGCSSCPPADRLLSKLAASPEWKGRVLPLAFHVDYWNYIGWTDPFSAEDWSLRQRLYAAVWKSSRIYTPQLIVNGTADCVGSQRSCVQEAIRSAIAQPPRAKVGLDLLAETGKELKLQVEAQRLIQGDEGDLSLMVAVIESSLSTPIETGENARRTLDNDYVVRWLGPALLLEAGVGKRSTVSLSVPLSPAWDRENLEVAAFLQDTQTFKIYGATRQALR